MQKTGKEIFLEYFIDEKHYPLSTDDEYPGTGHGISRHNLRADSNLLQRFPCCCHVPVAREETGNDLPVFFKKYTHEEIGRHYGRSRTTAGYHIRRTLRQLQREMEGIAYEKRRASPLCLH